MQHGSIPDRSDEYWYQAEREILGSQDNDTGDGSHPVVGSGEEAPVETSAAPLGMTSQTLDEVLNSPAAPKTRKRKSTAAAAVETASEVNNAIGETVTAPKRRRSTKAPT